MNPTLRLNRRVSHPPRERLASLPLIAAAALCGCPDLLMAHEDLPGPPTLQVRGFVKDVKLTAGFDNELGQEEWILKVRFDHQGHAVRDIEAFGVGAKPPFCDSEFCGVGQGNWETKAQSDTPFNHPARQSFANANELRWSHIDCTPRNQVLVSASLVEKDVDPFGDTFANALSTGLPLVGNVLWYLVNLPRGNEDYGTGLGTLPPNAPVEVQLTGGSGGAAKVTFEGTTLQTGAQDCAGGEFDEYAALSVGEKLEEFDRLGTALALAAALDVETGNPGLLSVAEIANARTTGRSLVLGTAALIAGSEIQAASDFAGVADAIAAFGSAREAALEGQDTQALAGFREAYGIAATLLENPIDGPPTFLDRHVSLVPNLLAVRPNGYLEIGGMVLGLRPDDEVTNLTLIGKSGGMFADVAPAGPDRLVLQTAVALAPDVPAGQLLGLRRISGGTVQAPAVGCEFTHLRDFSFGGIFVDGIGPFFDPDPDGCGYGAIHTTRLPVRRGGIVPGDSFESSGFVIELRLDEVEPGSYPLTVSAEVTTVGDGILMLSAPLTLIVEQNCCGLFRHGFEDDGQLAAEVASTR